MSHLQTLQCLSEITPDTVFGVSLAVGLSILIAVIAATWRAANYLRDMRDEVRSIRREMQETWTCTDMERWSARLERENRDAGKILSVPDPIDIRASRQSPASGI
jgi:predicted Holliday junction resolvase-like endonuclease